MVNMIQAALATTHTEEKIELLNKIFIAVGEDNLETKVYKPVLKKMKKEKMPLRHIPCLADNKTLRGKIAEKMKKL